MKFPASGARDPGYASYTRTIAKRHQGYVTMTRNNCCLKPAPYLALCLALLMFTGCGYRFQPSGQNIDAQIKTVFIENFANQTSEANIEDQFRASFGDLFTRSQRFRLAADKANAHAILTGSILSIATTHLTAGKDSQALEERITMALDLAFIRQDGKQVLWSARNIAGTTEYLIDRNSEITSKNRKDALLRLNRDLSERAYQLMMSGF